MLTTTELYRFGVYAERIHRLALDVAIQSGLMGDFGKGIAVVADETRNIGAKLLSAYAHMMEHNEVPASMDEDLLQLKTLILNARIEVAWASKDYHRNRPTATKYMPLAVLFDEIGTILTELIELLHKKPDLPPVLLKAAPINRVIDVNLTLLLFTSGGVQFVENMQYVQEIVRNLRGAPLEDTLFLRGFTFPILRVKEKLAPGASGDDPFFAIVSTGYDEENIRYAIPVDSLPTIFRSNFGVQAPCRLDIPEELTRACWNAEEGRQMVFLDYRKFAE